MSVRILHLLLLSLLPTLLMPIGAAAQEGRHALLIGNTSYTGKSLPALENPQKDVAVLRTALIAAGWPADNIRTVADTDRATLWTEVQAFSDRIDGGVGFFYYSGHGGSALLNGSLDNYLVPIEEDLEFAEDLPIHGYRMSDLIETLENAETAGTFVVIDACRNPLPSRTVKGTGTKGLLAMQSANIFLAYATPDGQFARDDGIYARILAEEIRQAGQNADTVFLKASRRVGRLRETERNPVVQPSLIGEMCFLSCPEEVDSDDLDWQRFSSLGLYREYLLLNENGKYREQAEALLELSANTTAAPESATLNSEPKVTRAEPGDSFRDSLRSGGQGPEMVVIPAGSFTMGSPSSEVGRDPDIEGPRHEVTIANNFAVGKFEVTWSEWEACVAAGGCDGAGPKSTDDTYGDLSEDAGWGKQDRPVINVDWKDAKDYAAWLSAATGEPYRLLSEAEWEYAARGGTQTAWPWGGDINGRCSFSNTDEFSTLSILGVTMSSTCDDGYENQTAPVGTYQSNAFGLHDMHGNVMEWVEDCRHWDYTNAPEDGRAWTFGCGGTGTSRIVRGGSFTVTATRARSATRFFTRKTSRNRYRGFRVARDLAQ